MRPVSVVCWSVLCGLLASCGDGDGDATLAWQGAAPHFVVRGVIDGRDLDLELDGSNAVIACEREYVLPLVDGVEDPSMAVNVEIELTATFQYMGQEYTFQVELKQHDLQSDSVGAVVSVVPRVDTMLPQQDEVWLEFEWESADEVDQFEQAAQQGTLTLQLFGGAPPQGSNIIPEGEGSVGFTASAVWSASEHLEFSITAPCLTNDIEVLE